MKLKKELKFRSTIEQTETYTCNAAQVISQYLKTLRNEYTIDDTQVFSKHIKDLPPLQEDEEDVSYDVESLLINIPINKTIEYILDQIYSNILYVLNYFKRLLTKLAAEVTFTINKNFYKQTDGCTMGGPLSVTLSDIYMKKMEKDIVVPTKSVFCRRFGDDIYNRRKKEHRINYIIHLIIIVRTSNQQLQLVLLSFQTPSYLTKMEHTSLKYTEKKLKHQYTAHHAFPKGIIETV